MTREEAIAAGMEMHETQHSMKRRTSWHNYRSKGTYMLTLVVRGRAPLFGTLKGGLEGEKKGELKREKEEDLKGEKKGVVAPYVEYSRLGTAIAEEEIRKINHFYPQVEIWKLCIMPDHLHMIVRVNEDMGEGKHLGYVVRGFKAGCTKAWWRLTGVETPGTVANGAAPGAASAKAPGTAASGAAPGAMANGAAPGAVSGAAPGAVASVNGATVPEVSTSAKRPSLFEDGYCDKILMNDGQLDNWKHYLDDNPRRLMLKRRKPDLFTVLTGMTVAGEQCQVVGNRFLLDIPDKMAVIVHRRYTDEENARLRDEWLACGERGGVLVSAAISPKEKEVLREAMNRGYNIILLRENGFPKLYKPTGEAFDACAEGLLLQISPWEFHMQRKVITRAQCLHLNAMAEAIASNLH